MGNTNNMSGLDYLMYLYRVAQAKNLPFDDTQFAKLIEENKRFSNEYVFNKVVQQKGVINATLIPTSAAFKQYGNTVTICELILSEKDFADYSHNCISGVNTYDGNLRFLSFDKDNVYTINVKDIYEIDTN